MPREPRELTKVQKERIARLGAEWTILDSEEKLLSERIGEQYKKLEEGAKRPPELVELVRQQAETFRRKREISAELIAVEEGGSAKSRHGGRKPDVYVELRDLWIGRLRQLSAQEICRRLDLELARESRDGEPQPPIGFPRNWVEKHRVRSYLEAYRHRKCRSRVEKLISVAKRKYWFLL